MQEYSKLIPILFSITYMRVFLHLKFALILRMVSIIILIKFNYFKTFSYPFTRKLFSLMNQLAEILISKSITKRP